MKILQVSTYDTWGGAARIAHGLWQGFHERGHESWLAVSKSFSKADRIFEIPNDLPRGAWSAFWRDISRFVGRANGRVRGAGRLAATAARVGNLDKLYQHWNGSEDFDYPGTARLLELPPSPPDILHLHNLHGFYFDLRQLAPLSQKLPVVLNLHDQWLTTGHCACTIDCDRWRTGCGRCPDLDRYPSVRRDNTAYNWRRKKEIYSKGSFYVTTPSRWLLSLVEESILAPSVCEGRVIPNGIDLSIFRPGDRAEIRSRLGIPMDANVVLFTADDIEANPYKDFRTVKEAVERARATPQGEKIFFVALGSMASQAQTEPRLLRVPRLSDPKEVAAYYQAADIYLHAAHSENFPTVILEALATGLPVIATSVGGISEQVRSLFDPASARTSATGVLVKRRDAEAMAAAIVKLFEEPGLIARLGENAALDARERFDVKRQVDAVLEWYREILNARSAQLPVPRSATGPR